MNGRLELVDVTREDVPHPGGFIRYESTRWIRLSRDNAIVLISFPAVAAKAGVTVFQDAKYVSYREASYSDAVQAMRDLLGIGFDSEEIRP